MPRAGLSREVVVAEAAQVADEVGYERLTLAAVAERLGVAVPSLYKHVDGLGELHSRLALVATRDLGAAMRRAASGKARGDALAAVAEANPGYARQHPGCYEYLLRARPDEAEHAAAGQEVLDVLDDVFAGYGIGTGPEAVDAARFARSTLHGFVALENAGGFAMARSVDRSFGRLVEALDDALGAWSDR